MLSALLYSTAGLALFSVSALGLMATVAFGSIFFAVIAGKGRICSLLFCISSGLMFQCCAGITTAIFVGTVATTLTIASFGLVAVAGGAGTTAAAGGCNTACLVHALICVQCWVCMLHVSLALMGVFILCTSCGYVYCVNVMNSHRVRNM